MRNLSKPSFSMSDVLDRCLEHTSDAALIARANESRAFLQQAEDDYVNKAVASELYKISESDTADQLTKSDAKFLYEKLSSKTPETRDLYDKIKTLAKGMICPLCNQRTVSTLDHYLAKSYHAALTITPTNLVPSCRDCNLGSGVRRPASLGDQTIHPYFDVVDDETWLEAQIIESDPPAALFYVVHPHGWELSKFQSVSTHFESFGLRELYGVQAGQELVNIYVDLINSSKMDTAADLKAHFMETAKRRQFPVRNSWQSALYKAAGVSDWFCDGGYLQIANSDLFGNWHVS